MQQRNICQHNKLFIDITRRPRAARARSLKITTPPCMEPVFTVQHGQEPPVVPPAPHPGPGLMEVEPGSGLAHWRWLRQRGAYPVVALILFLGVTVGFAFGVYHARHSGRDLSFAIVTNYLSVVLTCCVAKLRQVRRDPSTAMAAERRRVRIGTWVISVALGTTVTSRIADAMPGLALKLVVWGVSVVLHGLWLYFLFLRKGAERCDAEELACGRNGLSPEEV